MIFSHPSEIILEHLIGFQGEVHLSIKALVLGQKDLIEEDAKRLAKTFDTTPEYWMNLQHQWNDMNRYLGEDSQLEDMAREVIMPLSAINQVIKSSTPVRTYLDEDKENPVIVMTERSYQYLRSKCTSNEAWDLGWLGESEEHVRKACMPEAVLNLLHGTPNPLTVSDEEKFLKSHERGTLSLKSS